MSSFSTYRVRPNNRTPSHYDRGWCLNAPRLKQWCQLIELDCSGIRFTVVLPAVPLIELDCTLQLDSIEKTDKAPTSCCQGSIIFCSKQTHAAFKMASLSIASLISFFAAEKKLIERGENHYKSDHIEAFTYHQGVLRGEVHASMKKKVCKVTVSLHQNGAIDRYNSRCNICGSFEVSGQTSSFSTYRVRPNNRTRSHYDRGRGLNAPRFPRLKRHGWQSTSIKCNRVRQLSSLIVFDCATVETVVTVTTNWKSCSVAQDTILIHSLYVVRVPMVFPYPLTNHITIRARMPSEVEAELIALFRMRVHDVDSFESGKKWWKGNR